MDDIKVIYQKLEENPEWMQQIDLIDRYKEDLEHNIDAMFSETKTVLHDGCTALNTLLGSIDQPQKKTGEQDYKAKSAVIEAALPLKKLLSGLMDELKILGVLP
jgi:hypothetical protein